MVTNNTIRRKLSKYSLFLRSASRREAPRWVLRNKDCGRSDLHTFRADGHQDVQLLEWLCVSEGGPDRGKVLLCNGRVGGGVQWWANVGLWEATNGGVRKTTNGRLFKSTNGRVWEATNGGFWKAPCRRGILSSSRLVSLMTWCVVVLCGMGEEALSKRFLPPHCLVEDSKIIARQGKLGL